MLRRLLVPVLVFLVWVPVAHAWSWPVHGPVLQSFLYDEAHPYAAGQHRGIDIGADTAGEQVVAPAAGTVSFAGTVPTSGLSLTVQTADGYSVTLTHLGSIVVGRGVAVAEGAIVGTIGPSGTPEVAGPYVHLGIRVTTDPNGYLDPLSLLPAASPPPTDSGAGDGSSSQPAVDSGDSAGAGAPTAPPTASSSSSGGVVAPPASGAGSSSSANAGSSATPSSRTAASSGHVHRRPTSVHSGRPATRGAAVESSAPVAQRSHRPRQRPASARPHATPKAPQPAQAAQLPTGSVRSQPQRPERPAASPLPLLGASPLAAPQAAPVVPLVLNGAAALVAIATACLARLARVRRRDVEPAAVLDFRRSPHGRRERCAA